MFIIPMLSIERQLYEMCLEASLRSIEQSTQPFAVDTQNAVQILRLVEDFLISTGMNIQHHQSFIICKNNMYQKVLLLTVFSKKQTFKSVFKVFKIHKYYFFCF